MLQKRLKSEDANSHGDAHRREQRIHLRRGTKGISEQPDPESSRPNQAAGTYWMRTRASAVSPSRATAAWTVPRTKSLRDLDPDGGGGTVHCPAVEACREEEEPR
jgi:hypothetical protein